MIWPRISPSKTIFYRLYSFLVGSIFYVKEVHTIECTRVQKSIQESVHVNRSPYKYDNHLELVLVLGPALDAPAVHHILRLARLHSSAYRNIFSIRLGFR